MQEMFFTDVQPATIRSDGLVAIVLSKREDREGIVPVAVLVCHRVDLLKLKKAIELPVAE